MKPIGQEKKRKHPDELSREVPERSRKVCPGDSPAQFIDEFSRTPAVTRRSFLNAAGFSISASFLAACSQGRVEEAVPYLIRPEEVTPGKAAWYASTCSGCSAGCGILAKNRDGRPIKIEGNPDHPLSRGGVCPVGQATILDLYDSHHLQQPYIAGEEADWEQVDREITKQLEQPRGAVYFLTGTITSPTTRAVIGRFLERYEDSAHVTYDPVSYSSILDAYQELRGRRVLPHYHFDRAELIVSFEADFLGTWLSPVEFTKSYRAGRSLEGDPPRVSRHIQFEGGLSLTGSNADERLAVSPPELRRTVVRLAGLLAKRLGFDLHFTETEDPPHPEYLEKLAEELAEAKGRSLVISGTRDVATQILVAFINLILENEGETVDLERPSYQWQGHDKAVFELRERMEAGEVGALFIAGVNPAYSLPDSERFQELLQKMPLTVSLNRKADETSAAVKYLCPTPHFLESWDDAEVLPGFYSLTQPLLRSVGATRPLRESVRRWLGDEVSDLQILKQYWQEEIFSHSSTEEDFQRFWNRSIRDGFARVAAEPLVPGEVRYEVVETAAQRKLSQPALARQTGSEGGQLFLVLYESVGLRDGRHAENPWLQEMPDPVTKAVWDNFACLGPETARRLGIENGDVVRLTANGARLELPVLLQPGQHEQVVSVALGYGRKGTDRFSEVGPQWLQSLPIVEPGKTVGRNGYLLTSFREDGIGYDQWVDIEVTGAQAQVALTQTYESITVPEELGGHRREMVHETTLTAYREDPSSGTPHEDELLQLWPDDFVYENHHWGMAIDLNACTGCSACVISCQAENNVPVVGKDEVHRRREMHWIRVDRYYSGAGRDADVLFQPVMCQHCDHAPCEPVCPVLATIHSREGLNQQIYNRCVGTRYCANNCPYKVRRFNWFDYPRNDSTQNLVLNPDVTVRSRGVMEKCSMCIQRIEEARAEAMRLGRQIEDGEIQLACQQSCPADAIVFGDTNDPDSKVSRLIADSRYYRLLWEMNFRPSVGYLTKVRNRSATI